MRVLLSMYESRGDIEPTVGLAMKLGALGAEVRVCAPQEFAELPAGFGAATMPIGEPVTGGRLPAADLPLRAAGVWR